MQDIDAFLEMLRNAEVKIDYEYHPLDAVAVDARTTPPSVMTMPNVESVVTVFELDGNGGRIHAARFEFNAQGQLKFFFVSK